MTVTFQSNARLFFSAQGLNQTWQFVIFNKIFSKILFILLSKWEAAQSPEQLPSSFIFILSGLSLPALLATSRTNRAHLGQVLDTLLSMSLESVRDFVVCFPARAPPPPPLCVSLTAPRYRDPGAWWATLARFIYSSCQQASGSVDLTDGMGTKKTWQNDTNNSLACTTK